MRKLRLYLTTTLVGFLLFLQLPMALASAPEKLPTKQFTFASVFEQNKIIHALQVQVAQKSPKFKYKFQLGPNVEYWDKVAQCETRQDWQDHGKWGGGLGIYTVGKWRGDLMGTWERWGGEEFAPHPQYASKFHQIIVANRIAVYGYRTTIVRDPKFAKRNGLPPTYFYDKHPAGFGGWGCIKDKTTKKWRIGLPKQKINFSIQLPTDPQYYCPQYEPLFEKYGLPVKLFSHIAWTVSACNPNYSDPASGRVGLLGIFPQFHSQIQGDTWITPELLTNPEHNIAAASWIVTNTKKRINHWGYKFKYSK